MCANQAHGRELIQREQNQTDLEKADLNLEVARAELLPHQRLLSQQVPHLRMKNGRKQ